MGEFRIRYRNRSGCELVSLPKPSIVEAIRHARVLELHHGTAVALIGPEGEVSWDEVEAAAEAMLNPQVR